MKIQKKQEIEFFGTKTGNANSIALGYATETKNFGEVAVGVMNKSTAAKDPNSSKGVCVDPDATLFSVGCGGSGERKNALEVKGDGSVIIPGENGNINIADDFSSVMTAISDEKTQRETADNEIKSTLDTKADKTDVNSHLDDLRNYCFKLGSDGRISTPFYDNIMSFDGKIQQLNNNEEYTYADINEALNIDEQQFIYDKTFNKFIKIIEIDEEIIDNSGDFFRTAEPLDLTHTFYLDNEKTGIVENLSQLAIEESNIFVNLPYLDTNDNLDDDTAPQYIYDATDNKWIEVVETYYLSNYYVFNTEEPLDLTHELYHSITNVLTDWTVVGKYSVALGYDSSANTDYSVALGYDSSANTYCSIALGSYSHANTDYSIALGSGSSTNGSYSVALGANSSANSSNSIALGTDSSANSNYSIALGNSSSTNGSYSVALGAGSNAGGDYAIALGKNVSNTKSIFGVGFNGVNGIDMDRDNYGLYLKGFGGYDGTNLVVKNGGTETLNPNIKSVQQIINEKADASAVPTKVSQLTNDRGYLTHHQSLSEYAKKANVWETDSRGDIVFNVTETDEDSGTYTGKYTFSKDGGFSVQSRWSLDDTTTDYSFDRYGFSANWICGNKIEYSNRKYTTINCDRGIINLKNFIIDVDDAKSSSERGVILPIKTFGGATYYSGIPYATQSSNGIMSSADKVKLDSLPSITGKLSNITAATTTEDMVTKFNDLLADLKAKGYMTADVTA